MKKRQYHNPLKKNTKYLERGKNLCSNTVLKGDVQIKKCNFKHTKTYTIF